jgi:hypothetical protein
VSSPEKHESGLHGGRIETAPRNRDRDPLDILGDRLVAAITDAARTVAAIFPDAHTLQLRKAPPKEKPSLRWALLLIWPQVRI